MRRRAKAAKAKVKAQRHVAGKPLKNYGSRVRDLEKRLAEALKREAEALKRESEALEQQTATSEILRVISSSPTDLQLILDTIVQSAGRLCDAAFGALQLFDGTYLTLEAHYGISPVDVAMLQEQVFPMQPDRGSSIGRAVINRAIVHIADIRTDPEYLSVLQTREGYRTALSVPMLRGDVPLGVINVWRRDVRPFSDNQVHLVETFADQAVIAIENVRLFKELEARNHDLSVALDRQTATSEILRVIGSSPTDAQPVFDAIVRSAVRLLGGFSGTVTRLVGDDVHLAAITSTSESGDESIKGRFPRPLADTIVGAQVVRERVPVVVSDIEVDPRVDADMRRRARARGFRSMLSVPMLREETAIGVMNVTRREPGPFAAEEIALLQTFADQAVIAIENVRLFTELQQKNQALTEAHRQVTESLEQQTATSEILSTIAHALTDVQPVFETIVRSAARLCHAVHAAVFVTDGRTVDAPANYGSVSEALVAARARFPRPLAMDSTAGMAILTRAVVHVSDVEEPSTHDFVRQSGQLLGFRSVATVPMLREGKAVGAILVARREAGRFPDAELQLLRTFADQAVIAVENVRLFTELQARTGELTRSVEKLTALGEISRALSSTLDVDTVLSTIVLRAKQLAGTDACTVYEYDERTEEFVMRATHDLDESVATALRRAPIRRGDGAVGRVAVTREPVQIPDIALEGAYHGAFLDLLLQSGTRALLAMPLLHEDHLVGGLTVNKKTPGEFSPEVIELLKTFAAQSALAIQNARLFREIADKSRQLEAASRHKSEFLANMSHELRTPLNAIIGFSEVLTERMFGELNEKQEEYLKDIYASGQHLLSLINDILDLSKIEAGRMELEVADFDLPSAIDNALILVRERASRRGITLGHAVDERLGSIRGDERKIKQVLLNLLSNALKFTPEGGRIDVRAAPQDGVAEISVADTGVGIAPEDQEAVFEEFRQVGTADKKVEGTGLGLALSRKFIELHGGRIWVESEVGKGSTFRFTLPSL